jgi:ABC-type uncharacterized transport system auxiliary subunit
LKAAEAVSGRSGWRNLMRHLNVSFGISCLVVIIGLVGCGGKIHYPSYYVLNVPQPPASNVAAKPILSSVAVRQFRAPEFLKDGPIVFRPSPEEVDFYDYHRWAEDPRLVVTRAMVSEIRSKGLFESVDLFDGRETPECLISGTLDHLEEVDRGSSVSVEVSLSARLTNLRTGMVLWQDTATKTATLDKRSVSGVVSEISQEVGSAVASLVSSMQDRLSTISLSSSSTNGE